MVTVSLPFLRLALMVSGAQSLGKSHQVLKGS